jgi:hypothetical protein
VQTIPTSMLTSMTTPSPVCHMILSSFTRSSTRHVPRSMRRLPLRDTRDGEAEAGTTAGKSSDKNWTVQSACSTSAPCASYRRTKHKKCILPLLSPLKTVPSLEISSGLRRARAAARGERATFQLAHLGLPELRRFWDALRPRP